MYKICVFLCVTPGEWDLPWPIFGSKDQCGAGADYHAWLWQGKTQQHTSSPEKLTEIIALSTYSKNSHTHTCTRINKHRDTYHRAHISTHECLEPVIPVDWAKEELKACSFPGECFQVARLHSSAPKHTETLPVMQSAFLPVGCSIESWEVQEKINNQW